MLAGGAEASITAMAVGGFSNMKALSTRNDDPATASRPYDTTRDGFVLGEGAAIAVAMIPFLVMATLFSYFALANRKWQQGGRDD